jgi:arginyl-tRNA synthetase
MSWLLQSLKTSVEEILGGAYPVTADISAGKSAWLAIPVFAAAKEAGVTPNEQASQIAEKLRSLPEVVVEVEGGFVNLYPTATGMRTVLQEASGQTYGESDLGQGKTVVVEFSGVNIAKPFGIGHLRSTIIGDSLQRLYRKLGYQVVAVNHLGDWGTQFGNLVAAYERKYGDLNIRPELTVGDLVALYIDYHVQMKENDALKVEGQVMFRKLEAGDHAIKQLWQHFVDVSLTQFEAMYRRLGVTFDDMRAGESRYEPMLAGLIARARETGAAIESQGALVVTIPNESVPLMLEKSDGSTTYATRDLAAIQYRVREYQPDQILYVVANEQALHFRQVFAAARVLNLLSETTELTHVKFGLIRTAEGKMSTRKGTAIALDDLLDEAMKRSRILIDERDNDFSSDQKAEITEILAIGAIKYFDLSHDRNHDIVFDWERALSIKGDSAPYLQYSYVRALNILKKAEDISVEESTTEVEVNTLESVSPLIRCLAKFPLILEQAADQYAPHVVAQYLNDLAAHFHAFYEQYPVLKAVGSTRNERLQIVAAVKNVLERGLSTLGIGVVDAM